MKLAAYLRVSTERQADEGLGLDVQEHAIQSWAKAERHNVVHWASDEGVSGSDGLDTRLGLLDALNVVQTRQVQGIVVYRLDRLARDLVLQEQLLSEVWRLGGRVFSTSPSEDAYLDPEGAEADPSRALIRQILGAVSQYERAMIRLRMTSGKARKRANGGFVGGQVPFGYRSEGRELVEDDAEQAAMRRIAALRQQGLSLRAIASTLEAEGIRSKRSAR
jgi:DNA invertase Pin-like site-specific DNA recombinase